MPDRGDPAQTRSDTDYHTAIKGHVKWIGFRTSAPEIWTSPLSLWGDTRPPRRCGRMSWRAGSIVSVAVSDFTTFAAISLCGRDRVIAVSG